LLEGEPPQIHEQELLQLHALLLWEPPLEWEPTLQLLFQLLHQLS